MSNMVSPGSGPRRGRRQPTSQLMGRWRITEMELWELDDLDLLGPAQIALERSEGVIRWSALGERCKAARGVRGIREMSVLTGIPQYRLRAIESGHVSEIHPALTQRYFRYLGIEGCVAQWCHGQS